MRELLLFSLFTGISFFAQAQIVTVVDDVTSAPIAYVSFYDAKINRYSITNTVGETDISIFENSKSIEIRTVGYRTRTMSFEAIKRKGFIVRLIPSQLALNEVVVSATRWQQETREVPLKVTSVKPNSVRLQNPQTAADLLTVSGEVFIQKSQLGGGSPMIRGFATNRVLIAVDGVRMNTAIFRSGNVHNVISLDPFATQNTEIIFGPGSVIYGSDAIGGVMSFYTLSPVFSTSNKIFIRGNSTLRTSSANNERTAHVDFNLGWKNFASVSSITYADFGDLRIGSNGPDEYLDTFNVAQVNAADSAYRAKDPRILSPTSFNQLNLMQKFRYQPTKDWDINFGFHYSESSDLDRYDRLILSSNNEPRYAAWYYGPQVWRMANLQVLKKAENKFFDQANFTFSNQYFRESRNTRRFQNSNLISRQENVDVLTFNLDLEKESGAKHNFFYGGEIVLNHISSFGFTRNIITDNTNPASTRYPDGSDWNSYSAYLSHQFKISSHLNLQSGLRYSHFFLDAEFDPTYYPVAFNSININEGAVTGSIGLVYNLDQTLQFNTNISSGYRAPNIDDAAKVFDSEPGSVIVPNPDLKPEYAYNIDVGIRKLFGEALKVDFTGYYTILTDALIRRDFTINGQDSIMYDGQLSQVQAIQNSAHARVYGIQAGARLELPSGFQLTTRINIQKGEEELQDGTTVPLRHAAPTFGETHLTYSATGFEIDLYAEYNARLSNSELAPSERSKDHLYAIDENGDPYSPSWVTINLNSAYQITPIFMISAGIDNITDLRYRMYSSGIAAPGRNLFLAVRANL